MKLTKIKNKNLYFSSFSLSSKYDKISYYYNNSKHNKVGILSLFSASSDKQLDTVYLSSLIHKLKTDVLLLTYVLNR